jgi:hypothetical protein
MGLKHVTLLKKPDAFELGSNDPNDPKVNQSLTDGAWDSRSFEGAGRDEVSAGRSGVCETQISRSRAIGSSWEISTA